MLCDKVIPCMFCGGSGDFTPEQQFPAHQCEEDEVKAVNDEPEPQHGGDDKAKAMKP